MQEETKSVSKMELMKQIMESDRKLTVLQTQISVLERLYRGEPGGVSKQAVQDIFGFEPTKAKAKVTKSVILSPEAAANRAAGAAKARAIKAAKKAENEPKAELEIPIKTPADMLKEIAEKKKSGKTATPKDFTEIRGMQQAGLSIDEIVEETGFSKESILKLVNDRPKEGFN